MSIIEKAISKSRGHVARKLRPNADQEHEADASLQARSNIERAMDAVHEQGHPPDAATLEQSPQPTVTRRFEPISRPHLAEAGLISPDGTTRSQVAEEFRLLKRPLLANAFGKDAPAARNRNLVMVTSSLPREGKSFCAINLAMSIAMELDRTVLLVDADVARPTVPQYLGISADGPGLLDLLADESIDFPDALIRTDIDNLSVLLAGRTYPKATEMLASRDMHRLISDMSHRYPDRIILFDSPPLLATSEAGALAHHMGQIVFVVEADKTPQEAIARATEQLEGCEVVVPLLNKSLPLPGMKYAHGYYGSYYRS
ncbi:XrtA-associated tyrosine autokinase [Aquisalimonas sp.]|uniref:XrtA-associated tyrosine autokinase n=1 Tax=Aquisalimonas sp. TaxID=1872621 RepID=UPI0025C51F08|nr:XrtA-associated tyrosine autokinase [Aquisalimonas sp.]